MFDNVDKCISELKMYLGIPPHDTDKNLYKGDPLLKAGIHSRYAEEVLKEANSKVRAMNIKWQSIRARFIKETQGEYD